MERGSIIERGRGWAVSNSRAESITRSRAGLAPEGGFQNQPTEAEGGCGVTGFACSIPVRGRHIYEPSIQMRNRGNGKGGGIAASGLVAKEMNVSQEILDKDYIFQVALLDPDSRGEVEKAFIEPCFDIHQGGMIATLDDYRDVPLLEVRPPDVMRYFVRVKPAVLQEFAEREALTGLGERELEDEFIFQNSVRLNREYYASIGEKRAFVLSHSRNLIIVKIVGYAEAAVEYYCMQDQKAHIWIAHQRYPTRGRVWHPAGAHPFVGLNEALVHNGDFANYHAVSEYLAQRNIFPQFLTDTEVSVLLFDLMNRVYRYPTEYIIEALAPTTELDFDCLPGEKQRIYRDIQTCHLPASPDGPWFFIIARSLAETGELQLLGITDTAMLRPQVFALSEGDVSIGLICSEKQAIDATLANLAGEDARFTPIADKYWNARGGSHSDGGAFLMTLSPPAGPEGARRLKVTNKFGETVSTPPGQVHCDLSAPVSVLPHEAEEKGRIREAQEQDGAEELFRWFGATLEAMSFDRVRSFVESLAESSVGDATGPGIEFLTMAMERRYPTGDKKRSSLQAILRQGLGRIFEAQPLCGGEAAGEFLRINLDTREQIRGPEGREKTLLIDAGGFDPEGEGCDSSLARKAYNLGWKNQVIYNSRGTRFHGVGFGSATDGLRLDLYDNPGDYMGSGMDGLEIHVHCNAQDQVGQIAKRGKMVIHGDVGQTFLYGAKGGDFYILGNAAGRPMINAVGRPRVVINGTALDYLAESFMAGDPLNKGGFAIVNGIQAGHDGKWISLNLPYSGSNLLSLASGGAIYVRDPHDTLVEEQLNGGEYLPLSAADWKLILPYLEENERLFGVRVEEDLLTVNREKREPVDVYKKVAPRK
jgi:glutamate synthase domain-containing protein 1/glutamate synthase domain-containing protein 3